jgi:hypothetical protein
MMTTEQKTEFTVRLRRLHPAQAKVRSSKAKRKMIKAGRRSGKTTYAADDAVEDFMDGRRILYATPTADQLGRFWFEVKRALAEPLDAGLLYKNETEHIIERPGTENRIRAKTAWNASTLRGDYADKLILDEWQLMSEDTWEEVGAPMLLDNDGNALFILTPPSLRSRSTSKATDPRHALRMYKAAAMEQGRALALGQTPRWEVFHFTSYENPYISTEALAEITRDMTVLAYRQEILAEDTDEIPGALWTRALLERTRVREMLHRPVVGVGVDPPGGATECGIVVGTLSRSEAYILADYSIKGTPRVWADRVIDAYVDFDADFIFGESNFGGDMVEETIQVAADARKVRIVYKPVHASRGKAVRAEPVVAKFEHEQAHIVGSLPELEDELVSWVPGISKSPNRLDAMVWVVTGLEPPVEAMEIPPTDPGRRRATALSETY